MVGLGCWLVLPRLNQRWLKGTFPKHPAQLSASPTQHQWWCNKGQGDWKADEGSKEGVHLTWHGGIAHGFLRSGKGGRQYHEQFKPLDLGALLLSTHDTNSSTCGRQRHVNGWCRHWRDVFEFYPPLQTTKFGQGWSHPLLPQERQGCQCIGDLAACCDGIENIPVPSRQGNGHGGRHYLWQQRRPK